MSITVQDLYKLDKDSYQIIDIRSDEERTYGNIENSIVCKPDEIEKNEKIDKSKKLIIVCRRGNKSVEVADMLCDLGYDVESLEGGYNSILIYKISNQKEDEKNDRSREITLTLKRRFKKTIWSKFTKAIKTYELIKPGDKIAICISGGKDSMLMATCFKELKKYSDFDFEVQYIVMDPGYSSDNRKIIEHNAKILDIPIKIFESDIFESVYNIEKSPCYICARMRRGYLYHYAETLGCNKIALGHHYDDVIETILMGMLYGSQIQTMMPKLKSSNFKGMELIRPLYLIREDNIKAWRDYNNLNFIQCACKFTDTCTTCNNNETKSKRMEIKNLIRELKKANPAVENHIFRSMENVNLDTVVAYKSHGIKHSFLDNYDRED